MSYTYLSPDGYLVVNWGYSNPLHDKTAVVLVDSFLWAIGLVLAATRARSLSYGHSRPILRWRIVMVTILCITAFLPLLTVLTAVFIDM